MTKEQKEKFPVLLKRLKKAHQMYTDFEGNEPMKAQVYRLAEPVIEEMKQLFPDDDMQTFADLLIIFGAKSVSYEQK